MAKRRYGRVNISPINPSIHFILFLCLALVLVVIVTVIMKQTGESAKATLMCPNQAKTEAEQVNLIKNLSLRCKYGVEYFRDANGCYTWDCKLPVQ